MSVIATRAPSRASARTCDAPMPLAPPVTTATLPARRSTAAAYTLRLEVESGREHGAGAHARSAVDLREADAEWLGDLPGPGLAAQLQGDLVHLAQARGADRLAAG